MRDDLPKRPKKSKSRASVKTKRPLERPPSVPEYLWERILDTQRAVDDWAERSFQSKLDKFLSGEDPPGPGAGEEKTDAPG